VLAVQAVAVEILLILLSLVGLGQQGRALMEQITLQSQALLQVLVVEGQHLPVVISLEPLQVVLVVMEFLHLLQEAV
jgi:hypothetical protein